MKELTVNDLVPQSVMLKIANRVAKSARGFARGVGSTRIPKSIRVGTVQATKLTASINILVDTKIAPQAMVFEKGAKPHPIVARNVPRLVFWWEREQTLFVGRRVNHPGMTKRPFIQPAKESTKEKNKQDLREAVGRNMRLQIRKIAIKV